MLATVRRVLQLVRQRGPRFVAADVVARVRPPRLRNLAALVTRLRGKGGLEVGGPSEIFRDRGVVPIYSVLGTLDGCNFAAETMWEGRIHAGSRYEFEPGRSSGKQVVREATELGFADGVYDVVLSSHCLEHVANPLRALREWMRVLKPGGTLVLVLPDARFTFDRRRSTTPFAHLLADLEAGTDETDLTHLDEILDRHDFSLDDGAGSPAEFAARARANHANRGLHHHVFDAALLNQAARWAGASPLFCETHFPFHLILAAEKPR